MKKVELIISNKDYFRYLKGKKQFTFSEIKDTIATELFQNALDKSVKIAKSVGLDKLTMKEIDLEIKKVRKGA